MSRMMLFVMATSMSVGLVAMAGGTGWAGESVPSQTPPLAAGKGNIDLKSQKAFISEALKASDVWTALQIDAYSVQKLNGKPTALLGATEIIGDPLFAFPERVSGLYDCGSYVGVTSGSHYYQLAPDGRPLALAIPLGISGWYSDMSIDGRVLGAVERRRTPVPAMHFTVRALPAGTELLTTSMPNVAGDYLWGIQHVAEDGSAMVASVFDANDASPRLFVARGTGRNLTLPGFWRPHGVGPAGAWVLAEPYAARGADNRVYVLMHGGKVSPMTSVAAGPGIAATISMVAPVITPALPLAPAPAPAPIRPRPAAAGAAAVADDAPVAPPPEYKAHIVKTDGTLVDLPLPMAISRSARVRSVGGWLLVGSGSGAQAQEEVDLIGNVIKGGGTRQPYTTAIYRWKDLLADPLVAAPVQVYISATAVADTEVAAVYVMREHQMLLVDLAGNEPVERLFATLVGDVDEFEARQQRVFVTLADESLKVFDVKGVELWSGEDSRFDIFDPQWMVVAHGASAAVRTYTAVHLDADPALRSQIKLQIPPGPWEVTIDRFGRRVLADNETKWIELDPVTGKALHQGTTRARPFIARREDPVGRYQALSGRVSLKGTPVLDDSNLHWTPRDAWRIGPSMVLLDSTGRVVVSGKKRGTYQTLGLCEGGHHFGALKDSLVIASAENQVLAALASGPVLVVDPDAKPQAAEPLPVGPWRIAVDPVVSYVLPRSGTMVWDAVKCGFSPHLLRSPPGHQGLLAITASLIFDLDPATAKLMSSPAPAGVLER